MNKLLILFLGGMLLVAPCFAVNTYVLRHEAGGDTAVVYDGMDQAAVTNQLNQEGVPFDFINESAYAAFLESRQPALTPTPALRALFRAGAIEQLNNGIDPNAKFLRAVFLVALDEINLLRERDRDRSDDVAAATTLANLKTRWAARPALPPRIPSQIQTAIQAKISSGAAD